MKFILSSLLSVLLLFTSLVHAGPIIVGNAAGLAELQYVYAWKNLTEFVKTCAANTQCQIPRKTSQRLLQVLEQPRKELIFLSGAHAPGMFFKTQNSETMILGTKAEASAQVYINTDLLYENNPESTIPSLAKNISVLATAIAYQSGKNLEESLVIGSAIGAYWDGEIQSSSFVSTNTEVQLNVLLKPEPHVVLFDSKKAYFLNSEVISALESVLNEKNIQLDSFLAPYWTQEMDGQITLIAKLGFSNSNQKGQAEVAISFRLINDLKESVISEDGFQIEFFNIETR
ncbi:hypothetical protein [Bdellovibrio sp. HCB-110]|uniref:hypothetical protein n=1 Tax=Bdellovibrio sp. HCB-110 TaxID=3391182 RepID=UPI0039B3BFD8